MISFSNMDADHFGRIHVQLALEEFIRKPTLYELPLPAHFSKIDRAYIHKLCKKMGLVSKSQGEKGKRYVVVRKRLTFLGAGRDRFRVVRTITGNLEFSAPAENALTNFNSMSPPSTGVGESLKSTFMTPMNTNASRVPDRLHLNPPKIPPERRKNNLSAQFVHQRRTLPIFPFRENILRAVDTSQITLIVGETGSGKSTQVLQYILDEAFERGRFCRIVCTEPRRIAALTVSERVANERGEQIGETVGYQIRLEKAMSPATLLTFCTNGILLRSLIGGHHFLQNLTHIIVDEVHERDRMSDFLLTVLREFLPSYPEVRLILMSATLDVERFRNYFSICRVVHVPGQLHRVEEYFLEDVLKITNYEAKRTLNGFQKHNFGDCNENGNHQVKSGGDFNSLEKFGTWNQDNSAGISKKLTEKEIDLLLENAFLDDCLSKIDELIGKIERGLLDVNSRHSLTKMNPLALVAVRGNDNQLNRLLAAGADQESIDLAVELACNCGNEEILAQIEEFQTKRERGDFVFPNESSLDQSSESESQKLLNTYSSDTNDDDQIDYQLILELILHILSNSVEGAILIFLPGYEDIISMKDVILFHPRSIDAYDSSKLRICMLHSMMVPNDQKEAFIPPPPGLRKIILSTNIAEVSVTIDDVIYVIDSGVMKERVYEGGTGISMLSNVWISKANALQRKGRAGRCGPGVCFRLYSRLRYGNMADYQVPEILRVPIHEVCLQTKLLFPTEETVADVLIKAPSPPDPLIIESSVSLLKIIGAMNDNESLTILGRKVSEFPADPQFAKVILYSVLMRCVEPVLIIVACQSYKDPFILPKIREEKQAAVRAKSTLAGLSFSDHFVLLKAFQGWVEARRNQTDREYCHQNFLSYSCLSMVEGIKNQMKTQLERLGYVGQRVDNDYTFFNANSCHFSVVKAVLTAGFYPNVAYVDREKSKIKTKNESVELSQFSTLCAGKNGRNLKKIVDTLPSEWLIYNELIRARNCIQIKCATAVTPAALTLFAGSIGMTTSDHVTTVREHPTFESWDDENEINGANTFGVVESHVVRLDECFMLKTADLQQAKMILNLREKLQTLFLRVLRVPWSNFGEEDEFVIKTAVDVLTAEDERHGLAPTKPVENPFRLPADPVRAADRPPRTFYYNKNRRFK